MTGSVFFPVPDRVRYRKRAGSDARQFTMTVPPETDVLVRREAKAAGVSVSAYYQRAGLYLAEITRTERESGLLPVPCRISEDELQLCAHAANQAGLSLTQWVGHVLNNAALEADAAKAA